MLADDGDKCRELDPGTGRPGDTAKTPCAVWSLNGTTTLKGKGSTGLAGAVLLGSESGIVDFPADDGGCDAWAAAAAVDGEMEADACPDGCLESGCVFCV
jgi:hypothetical protein